MKKLSSVLSVLLLLILAFNMVACQIHETSKLKCDSCGAEYTKDDKFCPDCGSELTTNTIECSACGAENGKDALFCSKCEKDLSSTSESNSNNQNNNNNNSNQNNNGNNKDNPQKISTPYDNISDLKEYVNFADYTTTVSGDLVEEMLTSEIQAFIKSHTVEMLVGDAVYGVPNRAIKKGDNVTVSTTVRVYDENGELKPLDALLNVQDEYTTANLSNYVIENVGNGNFLPEIENALLDNCRTGDRKFIDVQYDDQVQTEELKNKKVQIEIEVHKIVEVVLPEYDDAFIALNTAYNTVAEFEAELEKELLRSYVWSLYIEKCEVKKYPEDKLTRFQNEFKEYYETTAENYGMSLEAYVISMGSNMTAFNDELLSYAMGTVKEEMILYGIAILEELSFTESEYQAFAEQMAEDYGYDSVEELEQLQTREIVERTLYWEMVKDFLYNYIVIE